MNKPFSARRDARPIAGGRPGESAAEPISTTPRLTGHAPLVPVHSTASRALVGVIAILTFLAALCAGAAELVASNAERWGASVAREATVQVRTSPQRDAEADIALVADIARRSPGISAVSILTKADSERLLEPWLGTGLDLSDLPVPRLVVLKFQEGARPDLAALSRLLAAQVPSASLDDHGAWLSRLSTMASTIVFVGLGLSVLVLVATGLAVAFATQGAMAGNREVVEVLHVVGADDAFIAREFQRRFFNLGLKGSLLGGGGGVAAITALSLASVAWRSSPVGDQIEAMFGGLDIGWRGYAAIAVIVILAAALTAVVSRLTVKHFLSRSP